MFVVAGKSYVEKCCVYECLVCYGNTLRYRCLGRGMYNIVCDADCVLCQRQVSPLY